MTAPPSPRVLCVDDDARVRRALSRDLAARGYQVTVAVDAREAAARCAEGGIDVALVDLRLGNDDGIRLLADLANEQPEILRLLLTGFGDYSESVRAINEGHVFAFLEKPWNADSLNDIIKAGLEAHGAENDQAQLRRADTGGQAVGADLGALLGGLRGFETVAKRGHHERLEALLRGFCQQLKLRPESIERVALAARVHDLAEGLVPECARGTAVADLPAGARRRWREHPEQMASMLEQCQPLVPVAEIVRLHHERQDGRGFPHGHQGDAIPVAVRVFSLADTYDELVHGGLVSPCRDEATVRRQLESDAGRRFDPRVVNVFLRWLAQSRQPAAEETGAGVEVRALEPGMVLDEDLVTLDGLLLVPAGHRLNESLIHRVHSLGEAQLRRQRVRLRREADVSGEAG